MTEPLIDALHLNKPYNMHSFREKLLLNWKHGNEAWKANLSAHEGI